MKFYFQYKRELGQNAFTGICSFQHFNGEKLYSDCVAGRDGIAGTETENFECYPVTPGVAENGREEGYYPENSIAYIRVLWKEIEAEQGRYDFSLLDTVIEEAKKHKQTLMFRLMPHSTCERDDVPDWLKDIIPCPERPDGMRVKDSPTDIRFLHYFGEAIRQIGMRYDDDPTFDFIDISLPGSWGEGSDVEKFPKEEIFRLIDIYLEVFKKTKIMCQLGFDWLIKYCMDKTEVGWRGDGAGSPIHNEKIYPVKIAKIPEDLWKIAPVSFESYWWLGEWKRQGWDLDENIEKMLGWHISSFNPKSLPIPYEWKDKIDAWTAKMGYHYVIDSIEVPDVPNDSLEVKLQIDNVGVAPIYRRLPLCIKLSGEVAEQVFETDVDIRKWLPGKAEEAIVLDTKNLPKGKYTLSIGIVSPIYPNVYFAIDAPYDNGFYRFCEITL